MKASDIITQLLTVLPSHTALFSDSVTISTLSKVGTTVTAATSAAHGLTTGDYVYIVGASRKTPISSITRVGTTATAITSSDHDLNEGWFDTVDIIGSDQAGYNGTHTLTNVDNRAKFQFTVADGVTTPATGTMFLLEPWRVGFNGWYQVTVTGASAFTYTSDDSYTASAYGTMSLRKLPRISGSLGVDRAVYSYTKYGQNKLWAFVSLGSVTASKARNSVSDAIASHSTGSSFRQNLINNISVFIFSPMRDTISGRAERDTITDVSIALYKTLLGRTYNTYLVDEPSAPLHFLSHNVLAWNSTYYIHEFVFQMVTELTKNDVVGPDNTRAFRDAVLNINNVDFDELILTTEINLDEDAI